MVDTVIAKGELERLRASHGGHLEPEDVLNAARAHNSLLHTHFEWNDSIAAEKYRLQQARQLLKLIVLPPETPEAKPIPFYVHETEGGGYVSILEVMSDEQRANNYASVTLSRAIDILNNCPHKSTQKMARMLEKERDRLGVLA